MNIAVWLSLSKPQPKNGKPILKCLFIKAVYKKNMFTMFYFLLNDLTIDRNSINSCSQLQNRSVKKFNIKFMNFIFNYMNQTIPIDLRHIRWKLEVNRDTSPKCFF